MNSTNLKFKTLKSVSNTRWVYRSKAISSIEANYSFCFIRIDEITNATIQTDIR